VQFPTVAFVVFFAVVPFAAWATAGRPRIHRLVLVAAGAVFAAWWDVRALALLGGVVVVTWAAGRRAAAAGSDRARQGWVTAGISAELAALAFFKYYGFFVDSLSGAAARLGFDLHPPLLQVLLPLGLSFYTFEAISYLVDVGRRRLEPASLLDVATWLTFFPTLASGPITRAGELLPQLAAGPDRDHVETARAYVLLGRGLLKKLVVASFLATAITDGVFADPGHYNSAVLLLGVYAFAAQIYADFSGYTDMAIGIALLLGYRLPENFNRPYTATSVQDFWSRWHMTLSRWLRDYLFAPLTGRRTDRPLRVYGGIVLVMLLAGLWHGAAWTFVAFGAVHGVAMAVERFRRVRRRARGRPAPARTPVRLALQRVVTFHIVCLGWVFFASGSVSSALRLLRGLVTQWTTPVSSVTPLLVLTVAGVVALQYVPATATGRLASYSARLRPVAQALAFAAAGVVVLALAPTTVPAFIYVKF
jgi:D-alanyl-lipoteichoic acid acyltransferase DltB (MBOAT superfamily)